MAEHLPARIKVWVRADDDPSSLTESLWAEPVTLTTARLHTIPAHHTRFGLFDLVGLGVGPDDDRPRRVTTLIKRGSVTVATGYRGSPVEDTRVLEQVEQLGCLGEIVPGRLLVAVPLSADPAGVERGIAAIDGVAPLPRGHLAERWAECGLKVGNTEGGS